MTGELRIATRRSQLARWQADHVAERLRTLHPGLTITIVEVVTRGDEVRDRTLAAIGERGLFVKALEDVLLQGGAELAVHSLKDMETTQPLGLEILAVPERASPWDVWLCPSGKSLAEVPPGARIGTSSIRRRAQLLAYRPDFVFADLRGNVPTRIAKLERGEDGLAGAVLAQAGLERLGLEQHVTTVLPLAVMVPAIGQGALAIEGRSDDARVRALVAPLDHPGSHTEIRAERAFLRRLGGGCQVPAGALCRTLDRKLRLEAVICAGDGSTAIRGSDEGPPGDPEALGERLAESLLARGGRDLPEIIARAADPPRLIK
jgi:hydroxymethylbilane synthase